MAGRRGRRHVRGLILKGRTYLRVARALSSVGQSRRLIISWSQVQALQGAHFEGPKRLQNARACLSSRSVSTEAELRRAFSSAGSERSPHTREVTGSSPVLPTTQKKPRTQVRGFLLAHGSSSLERGEPKQTKRTSSARLLRGCGSLPRVSTERSELVHFAPASIPPNAGRKGKPRTGVQGFKVGNRKESESVGDTNLNVRQHCPSKVIANVFHFELNFFFMLFHLFSMSRVFNTGTTSG